MTRPAPQPPDPLIDLSEPVTAIVNAIEAAEVASSWGSPDRIMREQVTAKWGWGDKVTFLAAAGTHRIGQTVTITVKPEDPS